MHSASSSGTVALPKRRDSRAIAQRLAKRAPEHDTDVLDRVMVVDLNVAVGGNLEIEESVACETVQHVIEERHAG